MSQSRITYAGRSPATSLNLARSWVLAAARMAFVAMPVANAFPVAMFGGGKHSGEEEEELPNWVLYVASVVLVLLGGAFAGLTIALMGQDSIYLQVVSRDPTESQQKNARRVFDLLQKGKHWVLVTLLLSNVVVNESLPVVLDRCLGGGVAAVIGSTVLIVIFGEILPQSVCVRYGLQIGGYMSKPVLLLMYLTAPIAWPTAKLLDWLLGEDHGTVYKKSGLKTLVTLHKSLGEASNRLNQDEVTIISAVLDLKEKPVGEVMTPMEDVFTLPDDAVLDEQTMDIILSAGYSRIPIYEAGNEHNFVGMLLVKILITYDPEDCKLVKEFNLATLPETRPETSCLDIVNFFQEGKSHMVLVSHFPGEARGALGVVTLEDVIEELIGEEIIDESDVYIDVHKAIRRLAPAPRARADKRNSMDVVAQVPASGDLISFDLQGDGESAPLLRAHSTMTPSTEAILSSSPKTTTLLMRRSSANLDGRVVSTTVPIKATASEMREHLKHLGPSNSAANPKSTRLTTVKIKHDLPRSISTAPNAAKSPPVDGLAAPQSYHEATESGEQSKLLRPKLTAKGGVNAVRKSYGAISGASDAQLSLSRIGSHGKDHTVTEDGAVSPTSPVKQAEPPTIVIKASQDDGAQTEDFPQTPDPEAQRIPEDKDAAATTAVVHSSGSESSDHSRPRRSPSGTNWTASVSRRHLVRTGSITENVFEHHGVRKVVLETMPSHEDVVDAPAITAAGGMSPSWSARSRSRTSSQAGKTAAHAPSPRTASEDAKALDSLIDTAAKPGDAREADNADAAAPMGGGDDGAADGDDDDNDDDEPAAQDDGGAGAAQGGARKKKNRRKKRKGGRSA